MQRGIAPRFWAASFCGLLLIASPVLAQDEEPQEEPQQELAPQIVLPQPFRINGGIQMGFGGGGARSVSISSQNGVTTTKIVESGKTYEFRETADGLSAMYVDVYGPKDIDRLKTEHPDLFMHAAAFPSESGDAEVELHIHVKKKIEVADRAELKEQNPELHKVLEGAGNPQLELRGFDPGFKILQGGGFGEINEAEAEAFDRARNAPLPLPGDPIQAVIEKGAEEKLEKNEKGS